jgi:hypothetical protein
MFAVVAGVIDNIISPFAASVNEGVKLIEFAE